MYTARVDLYFKANEVSEELLAVIGAKTYGLLMNMVAPTADLTYAQIE